MSVSEVASKPGQPWLNYRALKRALTEQCRQNHELVCFAGNVDRVLIEAGVVTKDDLDGDGRTTHRHPRWWTAEDHRALVRFVCEVRDRPDMFYSFGRLYSALLRNKEPTLAQDVASRANMLEDERIRYGARWAATLLGPFLLEDGSQLAERTAAIEQYAYQQRWPIQPLMYLELLRPIVDMAFEMAGSAGYYERFTPFMMSWTSSFLHDAFPAVSYPRPILPQIWRNVWGNADTHTGDHLWLPGLMAWEMAHWGEDHARPSLESLIRDHLSNIRGGPTEALRMLHEVNRWAREGIDQARRDRRESRDLRRRADGQIEDLQKMVDYLDLELPRCRF